MTIHRKLLYTGVFFVATGTVLVAATAGGLSGPAVDDLLRLWPVAIVALGVGLLVRGTRLAVPGGIVAALIPGLLLGGAVVAAPGIVPPCGDFHAVPLEARQGAFGGPASVDLRLACGDLTVTTIPGTGWALQAGNGTDAAPVIDASAGRLSVTSSRTGRGFDFGRGADIWQLALPTGERLDLSAEINAGRGRLDLGGAQLGDVRVTVNAGETRVDLGTATTGRVAVDVNAGGASVTLPGGQDTLADLTVNAGSLRLCVPDGVGVRLRQQQSIGTSNYTGLVRTGDAWESPAYATAIHHADVTVTVAIGSVVVNPQGGCK